MMDSHRLSCLSMLDSLVSPESWRGVGDLERELSAIQPFLLNMNFNCSQLRYNLTGADGFLR